MAKNGIEGTAAMGTDTPLAALSGNREPLFNYFKQLFAQVTNPPIDSIREEVVTSTTVYIGSAGNLLEEKPENCKVLRINNPILTNRHDTVKAVQCSGHGDLIEDHQGNWWMVHLAVRTARRTMSHLGERHSLHLLHGGWLAICGRK